MPAKDSGSRRRWVVSLAGGLMVMAVVLALLRIPRVPDDTLAPSAQASAPAVEIAPLGGADRTLDEATIMHDQTPLFLPTERNVMLKPLAPLEAGGSILNRDRANFVFGERELTLAIPPPVTVADDPAAALFVGAPPAPLRGFGRVDAPVSPLPARGAVVEVFSVRNNERVLAESLPIEARPPTDKVWRPMEFAAAIEAAGLVGSLAVTERSDVEEAERYFRNYLARIFRLGERLPPGFYRVVVGP